MRRRLLPPLLLLLLPAAAAALQPPDGAAGGLSAGASGGCALRYLEVTRLGGQEPLREGAMRSPRDVLELLAAYTGVEAESTWPEGAAVPHTAAATLQRPANLPLAAVWHHYFSSWDARPEGADGGQHALLGTPGGDLGEFALALAAVERLRGGQADFRRSELVDLFDKWVGGRQRFYVQTGAQLLEEWEERVGCDPLRPKTKAQRDLVVETAADYLGNRHLRLMMRNHNEYGVRLRLLRELIGVVFEVKSNPLHPDTDKVVVAVAHGAPGEEEAFVNVLSPDPSDGASTPGAEHCQYMAPLIVPRVGARSLMVYHPRAVYEYRAMLAAFVADWLGRDSAFRDTLFQVMSTLGNAAMQLTKRQVLPGRPSYVARFMVEPPAEAQAAAAAGNVAQQAVKVKD